MKFKNCKISLLMLMLFHNVVFANADFSLDVTHADLVEILKIFADFLHWNIMINPTVVGSASLHLRHVHAQTAFAALLSTNGLVQTRMGNIIFVTTQADYMNRQTLQASQKGEEPRVQQIFQLRYAQAEKVVKLLKNAEGSLLSSRGMVQVDKRTNTLYLFDTATHLNRITAWLKRLDIPIPQLKILVSLASVDLDYERNLGVDFSQKETDKPAYSLLQVKLADHNLLNIRLAALESRGKAELYSSPQLFTMNQQTSAIEAGEEVPYQSQSQSGGTAVEFKKAVLGLKVTPRILPNRQVLLDIQVNQDRPGSRMVLGMPTISTRQLSSHVLVKDGQTIVLGGIYELNKNQGTQGVPFINKLPVIGWLFKQRNTLATKRELLIFVTPKILSQ